MIAFRENNAEMRRLEDRFYDMMPNIPKGLKEEFDMKSNWIKRIKNSEK